MQYVTREYFDALMTLTRDIAAIKDEIAGKRLTLPLRQLIIFETALKEKLEKREHLLANPVYTEDHIK